MSITAKVRGLRRRVQGKFGPKSAILLYHRVAEYSSDPYRLCVTPQHFEEHLQVIRRLGSPIRLCELARLAVGGRIPDGAFCITFDDGYRDNLYAAKPILERYEVPATVFLTTGSGGRETEFWWDQLEDILLSPCELPSTLRLEVSGRKLSWQLGEAMSWTGDSQRHSAWIVTDPSWPTTRHEIFGTLYPLLQEMRELDRTAVLNSLWEWSGRKPGVRDSRRTMAPDEVVSLESGGLIDAGAHTITHPVLSRQEPDDLATEVVESKKTLEKWVGHPVAGFAYPYGRFSSIAVDHVRNAGFEYACAGMGRPVRLDSEPYLLPRLDVTDCGAEAFEHMVETRRG